MVGALWSGLSLTCFPLMLEAETTRWEKAERSWRLRTRTSEREKKNALPSKSCSAADQTENFSRGITLYGGRSSVPLERSSVLTLRRKTNCWHTTRKQVWDLEGVFLSPRRAVLSRAAKHPAWRLLLKKREPSSFPLNPLSPQQSLSVQTDQVVAAAVEVAVGLPATRQGKHKVLHLSFLSGKGMKA